MNHRRGREGVINQGSRGQGLTAVRRISHEPIGGEPPQIREIAEPDAEEAQHADGTK